jgi:hypothetical protein
VNINFFEKNISEIQQDNKLKLFGLFLLGTHFLTAFFWLHFSFTFGPICWPGLDGCESISFFVQNNWNYFVGFYVFLALGVFYVWTRNGLRFFYWGLLLLVGIKLMLQLSDYRLMGNYHYMPQILTLAYLFLPRKIDVVRIFIVLFYFSAGMIKFNTDWFSGAALLKVPIINGFWLQVALAYVVLLEMFFVFFLLSSRQLLVWMVLVQLVLFHIFSFHIVGYFYPCIMACLLSAFLLFRSRLVMVFPRINKIAMFGFIFVQIFVLFFEPDSSVTGRGRILSLNMLDARTQCESVFYIKFKKKVIEYIPRFEHFGTRIQCDPALFFSQVKKLCLEKASDASFTDIDFVNQTRRISNPKAISKQVFLNVCKHPLSLSFLGDLHQ